MWILRPDQTDVEKRFNAPELVALKESMALKPVKVQTIEELKNLVDVHKFHNRELRREIKRLRDRNKELEKIARKHDVSRYF